MGAESAGSLREKADRNGLWLNKRRDAQEKASVPQRHGTANVLSSNSLSVGLLPNRRKR